MEELGENDYEIIFLPGKLNKLADALSRIPNGTNELMGDLDSFPKGFKLIRIPEALFKALTLMVYEDMSHREEIRNKLIEEYLNRVTLYNLGMDKKRKEIQQMEIPGTLVCSEMLKDFTNVYGIVNCLRNGFLIHQI